MTIQVDATFHDGVLMLKSPVALAEGEEVHLIIQPLSSKDEGPEDAEPLDDPLAGVIGICEGPGYSLAERHDEILYGLSRKVSVEDDPDDPLAGVIGICDEADAPTDGAENHDKYIYGKLRP